MCKKEEVGHELFVASKVNVINMNQLDMQLSRAGQQLHIDLKIVLARSINTRPKASAVVQCCVLSVFVWAA